MSEFTIVVDSVEANIISIETSFIDNIGVVEIERFSSPSVNILGSSAIIGINDLPDIPFSKITGDIDVSRVSNLDDYLDSYSFDCGSP
jgi:hypothetical protein